MENITADLLLEKAFPGTNKSEKWADLGCGKGFFTEALARQLASNSTIFAVDKTNSLSLTFSSKIQIQFQKADFEKDHLILPSLDGILMANSLHFVDDKKKLIQKLSKHVSKDGQFIIVEYDTDKANPWVPHPVSFPELQKLFNEMGFKSIQKLAETRSLYGSGMIYSSLITNY